ncbi:MAG: type II toxin-antitoxin system PemK/MazF family toxin [Acetobacteraceae bacterium]|nr:type II toxin-antitoxin system PemK/MazF family toxin [Acetobacteraceae bacterium]MBV8590325.1 type II toxin-antitoxin system PemK/MazF family toxin [Acetobacteraceae bacterium]
MRRGDVVTLADRTGDFTGKPRPAVIVQSDLFAPLGSVAVCPVTSIDAGPAISRLRLEPSAELRLKTASWVEVDKITTVRKSRIGPVLGSLTTTDLSRLNGALAVFLGLA